ncbi:MAG: hypothetical protein ABI892_07970 [Flavobacterium sp.]
MSIKKYVFGKRKINTLIGGIGLDPYLNTPALLAQRLQIPLSSIASFKIVGPNIECFISTPYTIPDISFEGNAYLTFWDDLDGMVENIGYAAFWSVSKISKLYFKNMKATFGEIDRHSSIVEYDFPNCTSLANGTFGTSYEGANKIVNIPKCINIGTTNLDNGVFNKWWGSAKWQITAHISQQTSNNGEPDGDLVGLAPGSTVTYVQ